MRTPVAFLIFNRPELTRARLRQDCPRSSTQSYWSLPTVPVPTGGEAEKCIATRAIIDRVDWKCDVLRNYSDTNLGCGRRPSSGLRWVFGQVEKR